MADAKNPPECTDVLALLDFPLSAHEIAALLRCSLKQTMERLHICWWSIVPVTGDYQGFKYSRRHIPGARDRLPKEVKEFCTIGSTPSSPRGHTSDRAR
jgi:hypothetical protein